ncbi:MAG: DUF3667 domain-containing protein [Bacteroidia bacterium]|nr:DUF3667 domain-containing protein [Bacteroidia bacterium]
METCQNCHTELTGSYCSVCGQRKQERFTFSYVLDELLQLLEFDKGILYNIKVFAWNPGLTIREYIQGKTKPFYPPISFFFLGMTVFILLVLSSLEADGWSTGKVFIFDTYENAKQINEYYQKEQRWIAKQEIPDSSKVQQILELEKERDKSILVLESKAMRTQGMTYAAFYFTPLYLTLLYLLLGYQSNYNFTEHLIIHTFGVAQVIWFISFVAIIGYGLNFLLEKFSMQLPSTIQLLFSVLIVLVITGYYTVLIKQAYDFSWIGAIIRILITGLVLLVLVFLFIFLVNYVTTGQTHL